MKNSKGRIIALYQLLMNETDEDHPMHSNEIMETLQGQGYSISRNTLHDDLKVLKSFDLDIITVISRDNSYFLGERKFEMPELKMLVDAVSSSRIIPAQRSEELIKKIGSMASCYQRKNLAPRIFISDRIKADNKQWNLTLDQLERAINQKKQVSFEYIDYATDKKKILKNNGEAYFCSPYTCLWNNDAYYVIGYSEKHAKVVSFRIDRMIHVKVTDQDAIQMPKGFDLSAFSKRIIKMYGGEEQEVELICDNELMKNLIDHFGDKFPVEKESDKKFRVRVNVFTSPTFYAWIFQFVGKISIAAPDSVRREYNAMLKKAVSR